METYLTQVADYLLRQSWQIAVLAIVVGLLAFALRNRSAHVRYLLWLIVLAKCLVPPLYAVPVRIVPQEKLTAWRERLTPSEPAVTHDPNVAMANMAPAETPRPRADDTEPAGVAASAGSDPELRILPAIPIAPSPAAEPEPTRTIWAGLRYCFGAIWLIGACGYLLLNAGRALRTTRWLWGARRPITAELRAELAEHCRRHGFRRLPQIWRVDEIDQPFVWGLVRGGIYVPASLADSGGAEQRTSVLGHELSHVMRFDAAVNLLQVLAQTIYWFHPFVWWANRQMRREREKCCDETTVARLNTQPKDYSTAIIKTLLADRKATHPLPSLAIAGQKKNLEHRIRTLCQPGKKFYRRPRLLAMCAALLIAALTVPTTLILNARAEAGADQTEKADEREDGLFGPVRIVREERVELSQKDGEWTEGPRSPSYVKIYDGSGVLEMNVSPVNGTATVKRFDANGNLLERATYHKGGSLKDKAVYTYDADGKVSEVRHYDLNGNLSKREVYTYDEQGRSTEHVTYNVRQAAIVSKTTYTYTDRTKQVVEYHTQRTGSLYKRRVEESDLRERKTVTTEYNLDGSIKQKDVDYQDARGNTVKSLAFRGDSIVRRSFHEYDDDGNLLQLTEQNEDGTVTFNEKWKYDEKGNLAEHEVTWFEEDGSVEDKESDRHEYELDARGNWVRETEFEQGTEADGSRSERMTKWYRTIIYADDAKLSDALRSNRRLFRDKFSIPKPRLRLEASLYRDKQCTEPVLYFDRSAKTLTNTVYYEIRCRDLQGGVSASITGGFYDPNGELVQSLTGRTTDEGWHRGSYTLRDDDQPGVWSLKVSCEHADYRGTSGRTPFHVYPGTGVSSYQFCLGTSGKGTHLVLENKHLIAVFGGGLPCTKVLRYLYQKDAHTAYTFGKTNIGRFDYIYNRFEGCGEMTSNQSVERSYSPSLPQESESLSSASVSVDVKLVYPINEFIDPMYKNISIMEKKSSSPLDFESVWWYDTLGEWEWDPMDFAIGDTNNDGLKELVFSTGDSSHHGSVMVVENTSGTYAVTWRSNDILDKNSRVEIADVDHDGVSEIVVTGGAAGGLYIFEYNGSGYENVTYYHTSNELSSLEIDDFDGDGEYEIMAIDFDNVLHVLEHDGSEYKAAAYDTGVAHLYPLASGSGDLDNDGIPEMTSCYWYKFIVTKYVNGTYMTVHTEDLNNIILYGCHVGDPDNDGQQEVIVGHSTLVRYYEYVNSWQFQNTWNGSIQGILANTIRTGDADSDGLIDLTITAKDEIGITMDPSVWSNKTGGPPFPSVWTIQKESGGTDGVGCGAADVDNDAYSTNFNINMMLSSEDADWLEYRVHDLEVDPNIHTVFPIVSGVLGLGNDDHYRLAGGQDARVTGLKPNTWTDIPSDYCLLYDNSAGDDDVSEAALAWVRFKESENVEFQDVGLWNDTNGNAASRIRYDVKDATRDDEFTCLLVFTKGGKDTIDRWLPTLQSGQLPKTNFMTHPD